MAVGAQQHFHIIPLPHLPPQGLSWPQFSRSPNVCETHEGPSEYKVTQERFPQGLVEKGVWPMPCMTFESPQVRGEQEVWGAPLAVDREIGMNQVALEGSGQAVSVS